MNDGQGCGFAKYDVFCVNCKVPPVNVSSGRPCSSWMFLGGGGWVVVERWNVNQPGAIHGPKPQIPVREFERPAIGWSFKSGRPKA